MCSPKLSAVPRSSARAVAALVAARVLTEGIAFACLLAVAQPIAGGTAAVPVGVAAAAVTGIALVLVAGLREAASVRRGNAIVVGTLVASVAVAVVLPTRSLDVVGWLGRLILFALIGEAFLWRIVSVARGAVRWTDALNAAPFAAAALALAAVLPFAIDRGPLPVLALVLVAAAGVALSLARTTEELSLAREGAPHAATRLESVTSLLFALGIAALAAALAAPSVGELLAALGETLAPAYDRAIFLILLPLGYIAALVFFLLEPLLRRAGLFELRPNLPPRNPEADAALLREIERNRPFVVGGMEILVVVVVVILALVLLGRVVTERRLTLPPGVELERERADGLSVAGTLRALFPRARRRRGPPRDDGTEASALRNLYWRLLALAERAGHGWRGTAETPAEHQRRVAAADPHWALATPIVSAFEDLRYGEALPDRATVARARAAFRDVEAALRT